MLPTVHRGTTSYHVPIPKYDRLVPFRLYALDQAADRAEDGGPTDRQARATRICSGIESGYRCNLCRLPSTAGSAEAYP